MAFPMPSKPSICMLRANSAFVSCKRGSATVTYCASSATTQQSHQQDQGILCDPCQGRGWLICDFCKGKKTNVKAQNNRIYRRCPTCRAESQSVRMHLSSYPARSSQCCCSQFSIQCGSHVAARPA
ncbi:uncharacterized protein LOC116267855 isoform X3 [Nymphaea colorata]|nr:uncharacterized protein LOC116267855 isoform X3 [Nymphaea colorata]